MDELYINVYHDVKAKKYISCTYVNSKEYLLIENDTMFDCLTETNKQLTPILYAEKIITNKDNIYIVILEKDDYVYKEVMTMNYKNVYNCVF